MFLNYCIKILIKLNCMCDNFEHSYIRCDVCYMHAYIGIHVFHVCTYVKNLVLIGYYSSYNF